MEFDGCFPDAHLVLREEEYFGNVLFDKELLHHAIGFSHWVINNKQGYIQNGNFKDNFEWAMTYEKYDKDKDDTTIAFNFGDLLVYVPSNERLKWKKFYKGINFQTDNVADKLLFFSENDEDFKIVKNYWAKRIESVEESEDLPWLTKKDKEQMLKELQYLKQFDNGWRDLRWLEFRLEVLDKYRNNEFCMIGDDYISFLRSDKKTSTSDVNFLIKNNSLMCYAKEFINVPPMERNHWNHYQIQSVENEI
jgi:hypothetical protein